MTLRLEQVSKRVGAETHLYDVSVELAPGTLNVLLGPTLAGKTSLMRLMAGLDQPSSGRLLIDGADMTGAPLRKRSVAMVYQQFINYPSFTVYDNIAAPLRRAGLARNEIARRVRETAALLHIEDLLKRLPNELSGGQQQRTALARALVKDADLLLLDEPLVNLDYKLREEMRIELQAIFRRGKAIVVYATTEPLEALMMGGRCVVLDQGRVLQFGDTLEVYHNPASERVAAVFSDPPMNMIEGVAASSAGGGVAELGDAFRLPLTGHLAGLRPGRYRFGVRANHLFVARSGPDQVAFDATVELAEISGSETFIHAVHSNTSWVVQEEGVHSLALGKAIRVYVDPRHVYVFGQDGALVAAPTRRVPDAWVMGAAQ
ncbi:MAG: ABC transporter ATP-binding protein [Kiloniellales bacterium]